ncbi:UNVERIFIED_ORG: hypothetical protein FHR63_002469 [Xanthomonas campestris]|nr:hypothetical protein [Xanthomonas arboricola]
MASNVCTPELADAASVEALATGDDELDAAAGVTAVDMVPTASAGIAADEVCATALEESKACACTPEQQAVMAMARTDRCERYTSERCMESRDRAARAPRL